MRKSKFQLYNLAKDPSEGQNIVDQNREIAESMDKQLKKLVNDGRIRK